MFQLISVFLVLIITIMPIYSHNATLSSTVDHQRLKQIQAVIPKLEHLYQKYAKKQHIPGYAFGIMVDGKLIYSGSNGYIELFKKTPVNPHSMFRIASMTKSFTAMAILKLRDEHKLKLDDPIECYIPELKGQKLTKDASAITIRNLLTHSAGFPEDNPWGDRQLDMGPKEFSELLKKGISFANNTNSAFEYSNLGYALLGIIIDKVSGMSYQDYIAQSIWKPLSMEAYWDFSKVPPHELAQGYRWDNKAWHQESMLADGTFGAMGGMITSLDAFSRYVSLFQTSWQDEYPLINAPIQKNSLREMQRSWQFNQLNNERQLLNGDICTMVEAYGYGLRWFHDCDKKTFLGHSGGLPGFGSNWFIIPEYGIGVILLTNVTYTPAAEINFEVLNTLIKEAHLHPHKVLVSERLKTMQQALVKLLPDWQNAKTSGLFANNFFLDSALEVRKKESQQLFRKAGKIVHVTSMVAQNQLRGYFMIKGEREVLKISFTLSPNNPALIQEYHIETME
jgi:CubicO group peptidase (beta-lactamase class C family)